MEAQWPDKQGGEAKTAREKTERNSLCSHRKQKHPVFLQIPATALHSKEPNLSTLNE